MKGTLRNLFPIYSSDLLSVTEEIQLRSARRLHDPDCNEDAEMWAEACIGAVLDRPKRPGRFLPLPDPAPPKWCAGFLSHRPKPTRTKFDHLLDGIKSVCPRYAPPKRPPKNIFHLAMKDKSFLTTAYKRIYLRKKIIPPSRATRKRDGINVPTSEEFLAAYSAVRRNKHMDSASKDHVLDVLNRTVSTPFLLFRMLKNGQPSIPDPYCPRECGVLADAQHLQLECDGGHLASEILLEFFAEKFPNHRLLPKNIQFHLPIPNLNKSLNSQFLHLNASISKLLFALPKDPHYPSWSIHVFFAKIMTTTANLLALRKGCRWPYSLIEDFLTFFTEKIDDIEEYEFGLDLSHFRSVPRTHIVR